MLMVYIQKVFARLFQCKAQTSLTLFQDQAVIAHEQWCSFRHSGMVKMQLTKLGRFELYRQESVGSLHQMVQSAREEEC